MQACAVSACVRLSPTIEAKIASLTSRLGTTTTTAAPSTNLSSASTEQNIVFQARIAGDLDNSVITRSAGSKSTRGPRPTSDPNMYTNRYDFVAIEQVLLSPRLMRNFHECMMSRGPCTSEGSELKSKSTALVCLSEVIIYLELYYLRITKAHVIRYRHSS